VQHDLPVKRSAMKATANHQLGFPQTELFYLFQKQRSKVLVWLQRNPTECSAIMEGIVRYLSGNQQALQTKDGLQARRYASGWG
jgi:hypothetical protein